MKVPMRRADECLGVMLGEGSLPSILWVLTSTPRLRQPENLGWNRLGIHRKFNKQLMVSSAPSLSVNKRTRRDRTLAYKSVNSARVKRKA